MRSKLPLEGPNTGTDLLVHFYYLSGSAQCFVLPDGLYEKAVLSDYGLSRRLADPLFGLCFVGLLRDVMTLVFDRYAVIINSGPDTERWSAGT